MPYKIKKIDKKVGVYKVSNNKLVRKFKTKTIAKKMINIWNSMKREIRNKIKVCKLFCKRVCKCLSDLLTNL